MVLSGPMLDFYLDDIMDIFVNFDHERLKKMVFLNIDSFLDYIDSDREPGVSGLRFAEIIEIIEPFIPLIVNEENMESYLRFALNQDQKGMDALQTEIAESAKIKFVKSIFNAENENDIEQIFEICRVIREYREGFNVKDSV